MQKDIRFTFVADLVASGRCDTFQKLFAVVPKSVVAMAMGINNNRMSNIIKDPRSLTIDQIARMAWLMDLEAEILVGLILSHIRKNN